MNPLPRESDEPRRWVLYDQSEDYHPLWSIGEGRETPALEYAERVEVMPVSEHEATVMRLAHRVATLETAESSQLMWLRMAALEVVNQDRSTTDGEAEFEDAVHRLWLVLHAAGQKERGSDA